MELDRALRGRLGYSGGKGLAKMRRDADQPSRELRKAVYHTNKIVPVDKVALVAQVAEAHNNGHISERQARELLDKYGL